MLKNYFLVAVRSLMRQKLYTGINVLGLAAGLGICTLIAVYVYNDLSFESCHENRDRIFRLAGQIEIGDASIPMAPVMPPAGPAAREEFPEVEEAVRIVRSRDTEIMVDGEKSSVEQILFADPSIGRVFTMVTAPVIDGDMLQAPMTAMISRSLANRLFGSADAIGKTIILQQQPVEIIGVMEDMPATTQVRCDVLVSYSSLERIHGPERNEWANSDWQDYTYLLLRPGSDPDAIDEQLPDFVSRHLHPEEGVAYKMWLQPLGDIYLESHLSNELQPQGNKETIVTFSIVALLVLLVACFNFINLSTARTSHRVKEVGIRKVLGATRATVARQFLGEAVLIVLAAMVLGLVVFEAGRAWLEAYIGHPLAIDLLRSPVMMALLVLVTIGIALLSGLYPALYLAGFSPTTILGRWRAIGSTRSLLRRSLVTAQFAAAVVLVAATVVVYQQLQYCHSANIGFQRDNMLIIEPTEELTADRLKIVKQEMLGLAEVERASLIAFAPCTWVSWCTSLRTSEAPDAPSELFFTGGGDHDFLETFGIPLVSGTDLPEATPSEVTPILLNETAVTDLGLTEPIGQRYYDDQRIYEVVGVIKDFNIEPLYRKVWRIMLQNRSESASSLALRIRPGQAAQAMAAVTATWERLYPEQPLNSYFLDDRIRSAYESEEKQATLAVFFSGLIVLIASLGILGLSAFMAERRAREISIRRVLGSTTVGIISVLSREFLVLALLATVVGCPIAYYVADHWLERFAYRTPIGVTPFCLAGCALLVLALSTVAVQALRVTRANPADTLKCE